MWKPYAMSLVYYIRIQKKGTTRDWRVLPQWWKVLNISKAGRARLGTVSCVKGQPPWALRVASGGHECLTGVPRPHSLVSFWFSHFSALSPAFSHPRPRGHSNKACQDFVLSPQNSPSQTPTLNSLSLPLWRPWLTSTKMKKVTGHTRWVSTGLGTMDLA